MQKPKYSRCDFCGRNPHKVAVRLADGTVRGYCPSCYATREAFLKEGGATVVYDRRKR